MNITQRQINERAKDNNNGIMPRCDCGRNNGDHDGCCNLLREYERAYDQLEDEAYQEEQENKAEYEMRKANEEADLRDEYPGDYQD